MKRIACAVIFTLCLLSFTTPQSSTAQRAGASANGIYKFIMDDDLMKYVEFDARTDDKGTTTGSMIYNDEAKVSDTDMDGTGEKFGDPMPFYMKAEFDTMTVEKNRALMSGVVRDSSHKYYIGKWVQLVVEDNGDGREVPDKLVWRLCQVQPAGWIPSDYEAPGDRGAYLSWWATDYEQKGDVGIPSPSLIPDELKRCEALSLWTYSFAELKKWDGDIAVLQ